MGGRNGRGGHSGTAQRKGSGREPDLPTRGVPVVTEAGLSAPALLRRRIAEGETMFFPTCHDALSGRLVQLAGFPCTLFSGFGVAAARFAMPDVGLVTLTEMTDQLRAACNAVPGLPIIADGDTGYGNAMNVRRTVLDYAAAGAAAVMLEDQVNPKKCGHMPGGREVVSREEAVAKIRAAVDARAERDILIGARTDARGLLGFEEALARCRAFEEAGADIVFMEAPESVDELWTFARTIHKAATFINMAPKTPRADRETLRAMGHSFVAYSVLMQAIIRSMQDTLDALRDDVPDNKPDSNVFEQMEEITRLRRHQELEERYK
jgi:2-methylisocitrate lyase-like PEP mutase family enzyme